MILKKNMNNFFFKIKILYLLYKSIKKHIIMSIKENTKVLLKDDEIIKGLSALIESDYIRKKVKKELSLDEKIKFITGSLNPCVRNSEEEIDKLTIKIKELESKNKNLISEKADLSEKILKSKAEVYDLLDKNDMSDIIKYDKLRHKITYYEGVVCFLDTELSAIDKMTLEYKTEIEVLEKLIELELADFLKLSLKPEYAINYLFKRIRCTGRDKGHIEYKHGEFRISWDSRDIDTVLDDSNYCKSVLKNCK